MSFLLYFQYLIKMYISKRKKGIIIQKLMMTKTINKILIDLDKFK